MRNLLSTGLIISLLTLISCEESWFQEVDPLKDVAEDRELKDREDLPFLIKGVKVRLGTVHDNVSMLSDLLSDQLEFTQNVTNATFPSYNQIDGMGRADEYDDGSAYDDNNSVGYAYTYLGQLRKYADLLVETVSGLDATDATADDASAFYTGYLYGGLSRHMYATYFGLESGGDSGSPIDDSPMIYSAAMYDDARAKFTAGLDHASDAEKRILNSLIARTYLYQKNYATAATHAALGMVEGDDPLVSEYSAMSTNEYYQHAGVGRTQCMVAGRFLDYVTSDPGEAVRLPVQEAPTTSGETQRYIQTKYDESSDPINILSWQENHLMLAELSLRGQSVAVSPADAVNTIRAVHGLSALTDVTLDVVYAERDKELFCTGQRLPDQKRWNSWHATTNAGTTHEETIFGGWKFLPVTRNEKNNNPNL